MRLNIYKQFLVIFACFFAFSKVMGQTSGTVFRDLNGNGTRDSILNSFVEPRVAGVIVNVYNSSDIQLASYTTPANGKYSIPTSGTSYNGIQGSNTGFVAASTAIRLEFVIPLPNADCRNINSVIDFSSSMGVTYGSSTRFINSGSSNNNYAINNPSDYVADTTSANVSMYIAFQQHGNPAGSGTAASKIAFAKVPYSSNGTGTRTTGYTSTQTLATFQQIGTVLGVAYSRKANKVFTSAYLKRHAGLGPANGTFNNAPGAIYIIDPTKHSSTSPVAASYFTSLDALGYPTHNSTGTPAYGSGSSYTVTATGSGTSRTEVINYIGEGWAVIGNNTSTFRNLPANFTDPSNDPAAYGQVGKVGLGDIEISDDGQYLFVSNLYDRKIYQLKFNSITNPTSVTVVGSWALPNPPRRSESGLLYAAATYHGLDDNTDFYTGERGLQRPFAIKYYRGNVYIGAVTTGEGTSGETNKDDALGNPEYTDVWSYVWKLTPGTGFNSTPLIQFPMNFDRGNNQDGYNETYEVWNNRLPAPTLTSLLLTHNAQPMFTDIEFDDEGAMILSYRDRFGDQIAHQNRMMTGTELRSAWALGDIFRAYYNPNTCSYEIENNAKEGPSSPKPATLGTFSFQGPQGGEFYFEDGLEKYNGASQNSRYHKNVNMGSSAIFPGKNEVVTIAMDPMDIWSGGVSWFNNTTGVNSRDYEMYEGDQTGDFSKANGLGDLELFGSNSAIEIGNRVWNDSDADGIQDAGESGIANVSIFLFTNGTDGIAGNADDVQVGTITTNSSGNYYFTTRAGTDGNGVDYNLTISPNTAYNIRVGSADWNSSGTAGTADLNGLVLSQINILGNGAADQSDNDASLNSSNFPMISMTTGDHGHNNHSYDFGFAPPFGNLGNRVWNDQNSNGLFDEAASFGLNGITVELYKETSSGSNVYTLNQTTITANDGSGNPGYYNFIIVSAANYKVKFINTTSLVTTQNSTAATDNNSDPNIANGFTEPIAMNPSGSGVSKNNYTIDAGYRVLEIGNYVWMDSNADGIQDNNESGISGVVLDLYSTSGNPIKVCKSNNAATDFSSASDNDGSYAFGGNWILSGSGTTIASGELLVSGNAGAAKRKVTIPTVYAHDSVLITFDLKESSSFTNSENIVIEYHNGSSWATLATVTGNSMSTAYAKFKYSNLTRSGYTVVSGITTIDSIRFKEGTYAAARFVNVDNLDIQFKKTCFNATATTNASGYYNFNNLQHDLSPSSSYQIRIAESQGTISNLSVTSTNAGTTSTDNNGTDAGSYTTSGNISTPATGSDLTFDFGYKGYSIGNKVWWDNDNDGVIDAGEAGIPNVSLSLLNSSGVQIATTITDANGVYRFGGLPSGIYQVAVTSSLGSGTLAGSTRSSATLTDDVDNNSNGNGTYNSGNTPSISYTSISDTITLKSRLEPTNESDEDLISSQPDNQSNLTVDFGFYRFTIGDYVWFDADADGVQDNNEAGIEGVEVGLYNSSGNLLYGGCNTKTASTNFSSTSHNFTGSNFVNFDGNWTVTGGSGGSASTITGGELQIKGTSGVGTRNINQPSNYRVDTVRVSFKLKQTGVDKTEDFLIEYYDSTIASWVTLAQLYGLTDAVGSIETFYRTYNFNSLNFPGLLKMSSIRFKEGATGYASNDIVYVDDLSITFSEACTPAIVITDSNGLYNFNSAEHGLAASTQYQIRIIDDQHELSGLKATLTGQGTSSTDNNGTDAGSYVTTGNITSPSSGQNLTFDFGFHPTAIGDYVWLDKDVDGVQDANESGIEGVIVKLVQRGGCVRDNVATDFSSNSISDNDGSLNFNGSFSLTGGASISGDALVIGDGDNANRLITPPSYSFDSVIVRMQIKDGASSNGVLRLQYYNGSSYVTLADIDPSGGTTYATYTYSFPTTSGLNTIQGIQFSEASGLTGSETIVIDNLDIRFAKTCTADAVVSTTTTDANGFYSFDAADGLLASTSYTIRIDETQTPLSGLSVTSKGAGTSTTDNNGADSGSYISTEAFTSPSAGSNLSYDFGFTGYSVGNLVWLDTDNDGIKDAGESGIAGVNLSLLNSAGAEIATTTTDANGKYWFAGLRAGTYQVAVTSPKTSGVLLGAVIPTTNRNADIDNNNNGGATDPVGLTSITFTSISEAFVLGSKAEPTGESDAVSGTNTPDNQSNLTIDFGFNKVLIGDYVWFDANANGIQDAGERGIKGVTLGLYNSSGTFLNISATTDATGYYYFDGNSGISASTTYQIRIQENQDSILHYQVTSTAKGTSTTDNNGTDAGSYVTSGNITSPASGENRSYDFGFTGYSIGNRVWWDNNANGTKDAGEIGIGGVNVALLNSNGDQISSTTTDATGRYYFGGLNAGNYQVAITSALNSGILNGATIPTTTTTADVDNNNNGSATDPLGFGHTSVFFSSISETVTLGSKSEPTSESDEDPITDQPDNQSNLTIDFGFVSPNLALGNLVYHDLNSDGDYDPAGGNPEGVIANVKVYLYRDLNDDGNAETKVDSTTTNSGGLYKFVNLGAGVYKLRIAASNFLTGGPLHNSTDYFNSFAGDTMTDNNGEGLVSGNIWLRPNMQSVSDNGDDTLSGIEDNDANFTFDFGFNGGAAPVTWLRFKAKLMQNNKDVVLDWATATEVNNSHFEVERSFDGRNFLKVATVNSKAIGGNSSMILNYIQLDRNVDIVNQNVLYYRIKQVDFDGAFAYTHIEVVYLKAIKDIKIYPSPVNNELNISFDPSQFGSNVDIRITDMVGKVVFIQNYQPEFSNRMNIKVPVSTLSEGYYQISIGEGDNQNVYKFLKQ